jgi:hypothetical protein
MLSDGFLYHAIGREIYSDSVSSSLSYVCGKWFGDLSVR